MSHILPLGVNPDFLKNDYSRPTSLNYPFIFSFIFILFCWFFFVDFAFAQWVYFDSSMPCGSSFTADSFGKIDYVATGASWPKNVLSSSTFDAYVHCVSSASGDVVLVDDFSVYVGPLPSMPVGYSGALYTQAQLDSAIALVTPTGVTMNFPFDVPAYSMLVGFFLSIFLLAYGVGAVYRIFVPKVRY